MARNFNGTTDRIDWANVANLAGSAVTVSAWVYIDTFNPGHSQFITNFGVAANSNGMVLYYIDNVNGQLAFYRQGTTYLYRYGDWGAAGTTGAWHHILATHNGTFNDYTTIHIYLDGTEIGYAINGGGQNGATETALTGSWSVGGRISDDLRNFDGKIALVGVWNRVLTSDEIAGLAASKTPDTYPTNLVFYAIRGDDYKNIVTSAAGTLDGTTSYLDPPIIQPAVDTGYGTDEVTVTKASAGTSISLTDTASSSDTSPVYQPSVAYRSSENDGINEGFSDTVLGAIKPVGLCTNDILLLFVCYKSNSNSINITFDTGDWKEINDAHVINTTPTEDLHGRVFWKRAVDADVLGSFFNWVVTFSSLVKNPNLIITAYSGATTNSVPYTIISTTSGNGNCNLPSIITSKNNDLIIGFVGNSVYSSWSSSSLIERQDIRCVASYDSLQPLAGASGTKLISSSITDEYIGIILNLSTESIVKSTSETGIGSDSKPTISASLSLLESRIGTDRLSNLTSLLSIIDSGQGIDVISVLISLLKLVTDTGSGSDQVLNLLASMSIADVNSASDIESILKALLILITDTGLGDWGTGVELILDIADSITGIDTISTLASLLVSDSGTTTELINVLTAVIVAIQEYGSGSDQVANLLASLSVNEISTITEILLQLISLSISDVGREIEETTLSASLSQLDTASGRDALSDLLSALGITELGTGGDLLTLLASLSLSDTGSGSDIVNILTSVIKAISDAASGLDGVSISASMSLVDNGSGVDNLSLTVSLTVRDTGLGTDAISVLVTALKQILDTASGTDRLTISASLNIPETMYGIDAPTIAASLIGYDIGISSDSPQIQASLTLTDTSSASDILTVLQTALKIVQDLASGSDFVGSISASIPVSDNVLGADQIAQLLASLMVTDFGTGVDVVVSYDITTQIIKISFIIKKSAITFAFAYPRIEFSFLDGG